MRTPLRIIEKNVCEYFLVKDLFRKSRKLEDVRPRQWFHYLCRKMNTIVTLTKIAHYGYHKFDHATVLNSVNKITSFIQNYEDDRAIENELLYMIKKDIDYYNGSQLTNCIDYQLESFTLK